MPLLSHACREASMKKIPSLILLFLCLHLSGTLLRAQEPEDLRVSPPDPDSYLMPADARIESSARIDNFTLVVWGTTKYLDEGSLVNVLRMQVLRDTELLSSQRALHVSGARPFGFVRVISLLDCFLVIWNDRRPGAEGTYVKAITLEGRDLSVELRIWRGYVRSDLPNAFYALGADARGATLVWQGSPVDSSVVHTYQIRVDASGEPIAPPSQLGNTLEQVLTFDTLSGPFLVRLGDGEARLLAGSGQAGEWTIPTGRLNGASYVGADTSLLVVAGHDIVHYRRIFEAAPERIDTIPALDSATSGLVAITKDSVSGYRVIFGVVNVTGGFYRDDPNPYRRTTYYSVHVTDDSVAAPVRLYENLEYNARAPRDRPVYDYGGVRTSESCFNSFLMTVWFKRTEFYHGDPIPRPFVTQLDFRVDAAGAFSLAAVRDLQSEFPDNPSDDFVYGCLPRRDSSVTRISSDTNSVVRCMTDSGSVDVSARTGHGINLPQTDPGIVAIGDTLVAVWRFDGTAFDAGTWNPDVGPVPLVDRRSIDEPPPAEPLSYETDPTVDRVRSWRTDTLLGREHFACFAARIGAQDQISYWASPKSQFFRDVDQSTSDLCLATPGGWKRIVIASRQDSTRGLAGITSTILPLGWNPDRNEFLFRRSGSGVDTLLAVDATGRRRWMRPCAVQASILPADSLEYIVLDGTKGMRVGRSDTIRFSLPSAHPEAICMRLLGGRFLRCWTETGAIVLEIFDLDGHSRASARLPVDSVRGMPSITENGSDSSLVVLYAGRGVHAVHCSRGLQMVDDVRISRTESAVRNPAGAVVHDTLFVLWEDGRNGAADIYGNRIALEMLRDTVTSAVAVEGGEIATAAPLLVGLVPNPARDYATVEWSTRSGADATIDVIDRLGRIAAQQTVPAGSAGTRATRLMTSGLESGVYMLRLRSGDREARARMIVVH
jgi:hypothetical protein